ncbi:MAG TPA: TolC family outer membrane protein [Rhodocyclaceae bacterium]|nr:TolC family outer membrane protein [Rhodocyclaceae bacterium]
MFRLRVCSVGLDWRSLCLGFAAVFAGSCHGQTLSSLLDLARNSEPTYLGAKTNVAAAKARTDQALGAMLPQLTASGNTNANDRSYHTRGSSVPPAKDRYNSNAATINLTQPIWRYANIVTWQQAEVAAQQAEHQLAGAEQELFAKLVAAWCDLLAARDAVVFAGQQVDATDRQWQVALRGAELGAHGEPQVEDAKAKLDQALADAVAAETDVQLKRAALEQLAGSLMEVNLPYMRGTVVLANLAQEPLAKWLTLVEEGNPNLLAALQAYEAAGAEVRKQWAGHYPTLDMVGSYGKNSQAVGGFPGQAGYDIVQGSVGLQLNIPIFSGGTQSAKVDEALAQKEKARLDIETARRTALLAAKQAWYGWQAAYARSQAGIQAIRASQSALALARVGSDKGLKTDVEILQAEQQWRAAQRDFRKARYDQVVAHVKLKAAAGILTDGDVTALDALFVRTSEEADPRLDFRTQKVAQP